MYDTRPTRSGGHRGAVRRINAIHQRPSLPLPALTYRWQARAQRTQPSPLPSAEEFIAALSYLIPGGGGWSGGRGTVGQKTTVAATTLAMFTTPESLK